MPSLISQTHITYPRPVPPAPRRQSHWHAVARRQPLHLTVGVADCDVGDHSQRLFCIKRAMGVSSRQWDPESFIYRLQLAGEFKTKKGLKSVCSCFNGAAANCIDAAQHTNCLKVFVELCRKVINGVTDKRLCFKLKNSVIHCRKPHGNNKHWNLRIWETGYESMIYFARILCFYQLSSENGGMGALKQSVWTW